MTAPIFLTDPGDHCRYYACVKGRVHIDLPGGKYTSEPCHWCGGSGQKSIRLDPVKGEAR